MQKKQAPGTQRILRCPNDHPDLLHRVFSTLIDRIEKPIGPWETSL